APGLTDDRQSLMVSVALITACPTEIDWVTQLALPTWLTKKFCSAIRIKPDRANPFALGATAKLTMPEFVPVLPEVMMIQLTALFAAQMQLVPTVLTITLPEPPEEPTLTLEAESV